LTGTQVALASAVGGLLSLERKALAQFMLARPIVVAPVVAAILGDAQTGFLLGVPLELFFLGNVSYGASTPDHETLATLFAASLAVGAGTRSHPAPTFALALALLLALPFARLGKYVEAALERWNVGLVDRAEESLAHGRPGSASYQLLLGLTGTLLMGAAVTALGTLLGPSLNMLEELLPRSLIRGLEFVWAAELGVAAGLAIRAIKGPHRSVALSGASALMVFVVYGVVTQIWGVAR
jgi:mannose/fructose/N-acetylgalactosamine-specific phosphotransferase system component IIC